ncbi:alpha-glucosidase C-terminal domain-containing protein [Haloferax sp. DFSO52]|uniref:alpha-glucosidase C-terminal domain-containing protein n=1 Tax=Haloferax sp. DFSO52 TaxID=3388505 RepID=UPI003A8C3841
MESIITEGCVLPDDEQLYAYTRTLSDETVLVVLNWSDEPATFDSSTVEMTDAEVMSSNYTDSTNAVVTATRTCSPSTSVSFSKQFDFQNSSFFPILCIFPIF